MKILHTVLNYYPSIGGMQEVVKQLSERLVKLGHDITIVTGKLAERTDFNLNGVKIIEFDISGNFSSGIKGDVKKYEEFLLNSDFDIITNFAAQQWATDVCLLNLDKIKAKKVFVPTGFSGLYWDSMKEYFENMRNWMKKYDMNVFLSNNYRDINFAKENGITKTTLIPNGAGEDEFLTKDSDFDIKIFLNIPDDSFLILHVGSHTGAKGHKEAIEIFGRSKIKNAVFLLVGNYFEEQHNEKYNKKLNCPDLCRFIEKEFNKNFARKFDKKRLIINELNRKQTVEAYKKADLFLFPSKIECSPIVLFECMASKTPFLTSTAGNSAEIIEWSHGGLLLPSVNDKAGDPIINIKESVKLFDKVIINTELRKKIAEDGFKSWKKKFSWEVIVRQYENLYMNLLNGK